jgi:hypothetical protein
MKCRVLTAARLCARQGLSEVIVALGEPRLSEVLGEALALYHASSSAVAREGSLWLLTFLPATLGKSISSYVELLMPVIVKVRIMCWRCQPPLLAAAA